MLGSAVQVSFMVQWVSSLLCACVGSATTRIWSGHGQCGAGVVHWAVKCEVLNAAGYYIPVTLFTARQCVVTMETDCRDSGLIDYSCATC